MYVMVRLSVPRTRSWQLPQVLRRSTARATSAPCKVPATIIKGVAYHAECAVRILDGRRAADNLRAIGDDMLRHLWVHPEAQNRGTASSAPGTRSGLPSEPRGARRPAARHIQA